MEENNNVMEPMEPKVNPFEYVTIPISEYRELIAATAKKKVKKEYKAKLAKAEEEIRKYERWWLSEDKKNQQLRKNLDDAKALIAEKLGVNPDEFLAKKGETDAEIEKLADLQFEKGVNTDAESV